MWYQSKVFKGDQKGRTINIPTINLDPTVLPRDVPQGIYAAIVRYDNNVYKAALYLGPRLVLGETHTILELNIFDFDKEIYDETIEFQIKDFIRNIKNYASLEEMKHDIENDISKIKELLNSD